MQEHNTVILDLTNCKYIMEVHQRIKETFQLPEYYGCNWSAFHDMLRGEIRAEHIVIYGEHTLPVQWRDQIAMMHDVLRYVQEERAKLGETFDFTVVDQP